MMETPNEIEIRHLKAGGHAEAEGTAIPGPGPAALVKLGPAAAP